MPVFTKPEIDPGFDVDNTIYQAAESMFQRLADNLGEIVRMLADQQKAAAFWQRRGTEGVATLERFGKCVTLLAELAPEKVSPEIAAAGETLRKHQDGTVTLP